MIDLEDVNLLTSKMFKCKCLNGTEDLSIQEMLCRDDVIKFDTGNALFDKFLGVYLLSKIVQSLLPPEDSDELEDWIDAKKLDSNVVANRFKDAEPYFYLDPFIKKEYAFLQAPRSFMEQEGVIEEPASTYQEKLTLSHKSYSPVLSDEELPFEIVLEILWSSFFYAPANGNIGGIGKRSWAKTIAQGTNHNLNEDVFLSIDPLDKFNGDRIKSEEYKLTELSKSTAIEDVLPWINKAYIISNKTLSATNVSAQDYISCKGSSSNAFFCWPMPEISRYYINSAGTLRILRFRVTKKKSALFTTCIGNTFKVKTGKGKECENRVNFGLYSCKDSITKSPNAEHTGIVSQFKRLTDLIRSQEFGCDTVTLFPVSGQSASATSSFIISTSRLGISEFIGEQSNRQMLNSWLDAFIESIGEISANALLKPDSLRTTSFNKVLSQLDINNFFEDYWEDIRDSLSRFENDAREPCKFLKRMLLSEMKKYSFDSLMVGEISASGMFGNIRPGRWAIADKVKKLLLSRDREEDYSVRRLGSSVLLTDLGSMLKQEELYFDLDKASLTLKILIQIEPGEKSLGTAIADKGLPVEIIKRNIQFGLDDSTALERMLSNVSEIDLGELFALCYFNNRSTQIRFWDSYFRKRKDDA